MVATGSRVPRDLPVPGRELRGVHFAMDYLYQRNRWVARELNVANGSGPLQTIVPEPPEEERITAAYSSPLSRTQETARLVAGADGLPIVLCDGLREISHGRWEGLTRAEVEERYPDEYAAWEEDPFTFAPEGGESGVAVLAALAVLAAGAGVHHRPGPLADPLDQAVARGLAGGGVDEAVLQAGGPGVDHQYVPGHRSSSRSWPGRCAWIAVIATVFTMSRTVAPRDRSFTGLRSPCSTGPTATAPAEQPARRGRGERRQS